MKMKVNFEEIIDACAQYNVTHSEMEIRAMLLQQRPLSKPMHQVFKLLQEGAEIKENGGQVRIKRPEVNLQDKSAQEADMQVVFDCIKTGEYTKKQISELISFEIGYTGYLLQLLSRKHHIRAKKINKRLSLWQVYDENRHKPIRIKVHTLNRKIARENGEMYYDGSVHEKCGTTLKRTSSSQCVHCDNLKRKF